MLWPKKNSYKEFDNKKKFRRLENSPPPPCITFVMVRPLRENVGKLTIRIVLWRRKPFHALFPFKMIFCFLLILYVCLYVIM